MSGRWVARAAVLTTLAGLAWVSVGADWSPAAAARVGRPLSSLVIPTIGPGFSVVKEGPVLAGALATSSPNPAGAASALQQLSHSGSITTYERIWSDAAGNNEVQDVAVGLTSVSGAKDFFAAVQHSLTSDEIMSSGPLDKPPGAYRTTYFANTPTQVGVGQAIAIRAGTYVAIISYFSSNAASNIQPISGTEAQLVAEDQYAAFSHAQQSAVASRTPTTHSSSHTAAWIGAGIAVVLGLLLMLWVWRRSSMPAPSDVAAVQSPAPQPQPEPEREPEPDAEPLPTADAPPEPELVPAAASDEPLELDQLLRLAADTEPTAEEPPAEREGAEVSPPLNEQRTPLSPAPPSRQGRLGKAAVPVTASALAAYVIVRRFRRRTGNQ